MSAFFIFLFLLAFDQLSKFIILNNFQPGDSLPIIKGIFHISFVCNQGIAFGVFSDQLSATIWVPITFVIIAFLIVAFLRSFFSQSKYLQFCLTLILSGAIGNLIDRIRFGFVIDFLDLQIWPVFNLADTFISVGTALFILKILRERRFSLFSNSVRRKD